MKKFLITIAPLLVVSSIIMWILWGLKGVLAYFGTILFIFAVAILLLKWMKFVDKHVKD